MDFGTRFGALIAAKREELGLSLAELAIRAYGDDGKGGESRKPDVQKLERGGSRKPNARTIKRYRDALDLTQEEIDACRTAEELELARFADSLFDAIAEAVRQTDVSDDLAAELTQRYADGNPNDFEAALRGLTNALEVAAKERARLASNIDAAVAQILAEVERLNEAGQVSEAAALLARELEQAEAEAERAQAKASRLIEAGLAQAVLERSVETAVALELKRWRMDGGGFEALRSILAGWYERGRDKGLGFDLEVAIGLARACQDIAQGADDRGAALNYLAISLQTLGERESGTARLEEAVTAFRAALEGYTRERVPLNWALTQNNLGEALRILGERESGTTRLEEAVTAYRAALEEWTRERVPLNWALTQNNLGNALAILGARESGTARLDEAVAAYRVALEERTRERVPLDWAFTQGNLGNVEIAFFDKTNDAPHLETAEAYVQAAREVFEEAGATHYLGMADAQLAEIAEKRSAATG